MWKIFMVLKLASSQNKNIMCKIIITYLNVSIFSPTQHNRLKFIFIHLSVYK